MIKYAGIGSRQTPKNIIEIMRMIALELSKNNFLLRSGGAKGADQAFESGVINNNKEIFYANDATDESINYIKTILSPSHISNLDSYSLKLHARNSFQILGKELNDPVNFVICYTEDGKKKGGTRTAILIAEKNNIPIFNLGSENGLYDLKIFLLENYNIKI